MWPMKLTNIIYERSCFKVIVLCVRKPLRAFIITYSVSQKNPLPLRFSDIFPQWLGIFSSNFTCLLYLPIYARLQIFIQQEYVRWNAVSVPLLQFARYCCRGHVTLVTFPFRNFFSGHVMMPGLAWEHACQIRSLNL